MTIGIKYVCFPLEAPNVLLCIKCGNWTHQQNWFPGEVDCDICHDPHPTADCVYPGCGARYDLFNRGYPLDYGVKDLVEHTEKWKKDHAYRLIKEGEDNGE